MKNKKLYQPTKMYSMLCLSTAHLTKETILQLTENIDTDNDIYTDTDVYPKTSDNVTYGFFIYVPRSLTTKYADLNDCIQYAYHYHADWIMFDCEGPIESALPTYNE